MNGEYKEAIVRVHEDETLWREMHQSALRMAKSDFSLEKLMYDLQVAFEAVVGDVGFGV